tara:strand:- start:665 stop:1405 length:741 start_codon:yes stop_codon:yes gene_type:complete
MNKKIFCFIPARLKSTRLPNKMTLKIKGKKLLNFVYDICIKNKLFHEVYVATCDKFLENISKKNEAKVVMTSSKHKDCISRVVEAVKKQGNKIHPNDYIVVVQGDEVCITKDILSKFCKVILNKNSEYYNLISKVHSKKDLLSSSVVKCALNIRDEIIFMTRYPIPYEKNAKLKTLYNYRQSGIIAFSKKSLIRYSKLSQHYLEKFESIDMLRVLENGFKIQSYKVDKRMIGVDTLRDYKEVTKIL